MREEVRAARRDGRTLILIAIAYGLLTASIFIAQPGFMDPMSFGPPPMLGLPAGLIPVIAALAIYLTGLARMIRIYRTSHLEPETSSWRSRHV